jgi:SAM-dependent methyltransferase
MLRAAGELTLDIASRAVSHGFGLKDATPFNVLFDWQAPVFVDVASFEARDPLDSRWLAYAQFQRCFVLPLAAYRASGLRPAEVFLSNRDGLEPERVSEMLGPLARLRPRYLLPVTLPALLKGRVERTPTATALYSPKRESSQEKAQFVATTMFAQLRRQLRAMAVEERDSTWSEYMATHSYAPDELARKERFVKEALATAQPQTLLDIGCNTGHFSALAAAQGSRVVAIDSDEASVSRTFARARRDALRILPLLVDLARPTPALGWLNGEEASFLERARGFFDAVLMLAVIHHLAVTNRVPLAEVFRCVASLTKHVVVVEFVPFQDTQFQRLLRGRGHLFQDWNPRGFESSFAPWFEVVRSEDVTDSGRRLYLLRRR